MPNIAQRRPAPTPVSNFVQLPPKVPRLPEEVFERFPSLREWQEDQDAWWTKTYQALQQSNQSVAQVVTGTSNVFNQRITAPSAVIGGFVIADGTLRVEGATGTLVMGGAFVQLIDDDTENIFSTVGGVTLSMVAGSTVFSAKGHTDANARLEILTTGLMRWLPASGVADTFLYRNATGQLKTDGILVVVSDIDTDGLIRKLTPDSWGPKLYDGASILEFQASGGQIFGRINGGAPILLG